MTIFESIAAHVEQRALRLSSRRHRALGLTDAEYELILSALGREPTGVELAMLSLMWSEHCAYKHSKKLLRRLPTDGPHVLVGPGENAGAVDVGGGLAVAFKVESHNHPSAVEPFQGAATGVGGILRDVFALGARPIAVLDSLRFGEVGDSERSRYLLEHAVAGIGHYGNSIGVPTIGGEIYFESSYEQNCLINAMCVGLAPAQRLIRSAAAGVGNVLILFGALTGRDGIGGASVLASAELGEGDAAKRPSVQIGDPFAEKKLLECCLELLDRGLLVSLQDLGAAGSTSAASEMASKGEVGLDIDVTTVPLREADMEPFEIMVSESQERMLCVVEPERVGDVIAVCRVLGDARHPHRRRHRPRHFRILRGDEVVESAVGVLVDDCPVYDLAPAAPSAPLYGAPKRRLATDVSAAQTLVALLARRQHQFAADRVRTIRPGGAVAHSSPSRAGRRRGARAGVGAARSRCRSTATGGGWRVIRGAGAAEAVFECAANLACVGAEPLGLTNCLNFGNPEKPHVAWQLSEAVEGMSEAVRGTWRARRRRERVAVQRVTGRADAADPRGRHGRRAARTPAGRRPGFRARGRPDRAGGPVLPLPGSGRSRQAPG